MNELNFNTNVNNPIYDQFQTNMEASLASCLNHTELATVRYSNNQPIQLHYSIYGTGYEKVLLIMGLNATSTHWSYQANYFGHLENFQICTFDNRGCGKSSCVGGPFSVGTLANDALALLDYLKWDKNIHLVGVSMGGMIVQTMTLKQKYRFKSITLISTYHSAALVVPTMEDVKLSFQLLSQNRKQLRLPLIRACFPKKWLKQNKFEGLTNEEFLYRTMEYIEKDSTPEVTKGEYWQGVAALLHNLPIFKLRSIRKSSIRLLILHGSKDKVIRSIYGNMLSNLLQCPMVTFNGSGHMINIERENQFNKILRAQIEGKPLDYYLKEEGDLMTDLIFTHGIEQDISNKSKNLLITNNWLNQLLNKNKLDLKENQEKEEGEKSLNEKRNSIKGHRLSKSFSSPCTKTEMKVNNEIENEAETLNNLNPSNLNGFRNRRLASDVKLASSNFFKNFNLHHLFNLK